MAFKETLQLVIQGDNRGAVKAVREVGQVSTTEFNKSQKRIDQWGKGLTKAGVGMVAFGAAALVGLGSLAKQSEEANLAQVKLDNTLANMPKLAGENSKQFTDLATKIQGYSAADADAIIAGEAMLGTFNLTAKQIKGITPLVVDFSRKFGVDMVTASTMVGKALDGNVGALKRNGVSIDETAFKTDRYGAVQKALSDQVGGFARAEGATFAGSLERMKNQLGDLAEGVGGGAVDAFTMMFGAVGKVAGALEKVSPGAQNAAGKIAAFGAAGLVAVGGLSTLVGKAIEARKNFADLGAGLSSLSSKLGGAAGIGAFTAAAVGITALTVELERMGDEADRKTLDKVTTQLLNMNSALDQGLADKITKWAKAARESDTDFVFKNFSRVLDDSVPAARRFIEVIDGLDASTKKLIGTKTIERMKDAVKDKANADKVGAAAQSDYSDEVQKGADAMKGETDATKDATEAAKEHTDALHAAIDPLFGYQDALDDMARAQADVNAKQLEATAAEQAYLAAVKQHGPHSKEATAASLEMASAQQALRDANKATSRSALSLDDAITELRAEIQKNPAAVDEAKRKFQQIGAQAGLTKGQINATTRSFDSLAKGIRRVPSSKRISVMTLGGDRAQEMLGRVKGAIDRIPSSKSVTVSVMTIGGDRALELARRAGGGPVHSGKAYMVGEEGPELFLPNQSGMIIPNKQMAAGAMGGWGGGGGKVQVDVNIVGDGLMRYIRNQVRIQHGGDVQAALGSKR